MIQAAIIFLREGFEAFLIVAIMIAYLRKTGQQRLVPAVHWGIGISLLLSCLLGYGLLYASNQAMWEAITGFIAVILVGSLVTHMWRAAPRLKHEIEVKLQDAAAGESRSAFFGVLLFATLMITREGMETALLLFQVHEGGFIAGTVMGISGAAVLSWAWAHFGHRINLKRFFQVTSIFLLLFLGQMAIYTFHEFTESGLVRNMEWWHEATEPFSPVGTYGKWFSVVSLSACALWLIGTAVLDGQTKQLPAESRKVRVGQL